MLSPDLTLERPILSRHEDYHLCTWTSSSLLVFFVQLIQNVQSYTHCCSERRIVIVTHKIGDDHGLHSLSNVTLSPSNLVTTALCYHLSEDLAIHDQINC